MTMPEGYEPHSDFARKHWSKGREEGREEGREAGREEGRIAAMGDAVIKVLTSRGLSLSETAQAAILGTSDLLTLERWLIHAVRVASVEDLLRTGPSTSED